MQKTMDLFFKWNPLPFTFCETKSCFQIVAMETLQQTPISTCSLNIHQCPTSPATTATSGKPLNGTGGWVKFIRAKERQVTNRAELSPCSQVSKNSWNSCKKMVWTFEKTYVCCIYVNILYRLIWKPQIYSPQNSTTCTTLTSARNSWLSQVCIITSYSPTQQILKQAIRIKISDA